jgi:hypothetical protein
MIPYKEIRVPGRERAVKRGAPPIGPSSQESHGSSTLTLLGIGHEPRAGLKSFVWAAQPLLDSAPGK